MKYKGLKPRSALYKASKHLTCCAICLSPFTDCVRRPFAGLWGQGDFLCVYEMWYHNCLWYDSNVWMHMGALYFVHDIFDDMWLRSLVWKWCWVCLVWECGVLCMNTPEWCMELENGLFWPIRTKLRLFDVLGGTSVNFVFGPQVVLRVTVHLVEKWMLIGFVLFWDYNLTLCSTPDHVMPKNWIELSFSMQTCT